MHQNTHQDTARSDHAYAHNTFINARQKVSEAGLDVAGEEVCVDTEQPQRTPSNDKIRAVLQAVLVRDENYVRQCSVLASCAGRQTVARRDKMCQEYVFFSITGGRLTAPARTSIARA